MCFKSWSKALTHALVISLGTAESGKWRYGPSSQPNSASKGLAPVSELIASWSAKVTKQSIVGSDYINIGLFCFLHHLLWHSDIVKDLGNVKR